MAKRGRPRKLGGFEVTTGFHMLMERSTFVFVRDLVTDRGLIVEPLSAISVRRHLKAWGIHPGADKLSIAGGQSRRVEIRYTKWSQPEDSCHGGKDPMSGSLWRILTGKGMKAFMLTPDDSETAVSAVAEEAGKWLGKRKRTVVTNHQALMEALRRELRGWSIEASERKVQV